MERLKGVYEKLVLVVEKHFIVKLGNNNNSTKIIIRLTYTSDNEDALATNILTMCSFFILSHYYIITKLKTNHILHFLIHIMLHAILNQLTG